jgi:hypothetical protein
VTHPADGTPVAGATVRIIAAVPRSAEDVVTPSVFAGVGKSYVAGDDGRFVLDELDPRLKYDLVISAPNHAAQALDDIPATTNQPIQCKLKPRPAEIDKETTVTGRILDDDGKPIAGAVFHIFGEETGNTHRFGGIANVDQTAVSGDDGSFLFLADRGGRNFDVMIHAVGHAPQIVRCVSGAEPASDVRLSHGCAVTGRLVKDGQPMAGITVAISQADRSAERCVGFFYTGTDDQGRFTFRNLPENDSFDVAAAMLSLGSRGATQKLAVNTGSGAPGSDSVDAGDLLVGPAVTIRGKLLLPEGMSKPPSGTRMWLRVENSFDSLSVPIGPQGGFTVHGVPPGTVDISIAARGLRLSADNKSYNQGFSLVGSVEGEAVDLTIKLEADASNGPRTYRGNPNYEALKKQPLEGVAAADAK